MFDHEVTLVKEVYGFDKYRNSIATEEETTILCRKESVTRTEFYEAGRNDSNPSIVIVIHPYEYENQPEVIFEGTRYRVIRTYQMDFEEMELVCEVKTGEY